MQSLSPIVSVILAHIHNRVSLRTHTHFLMADNYSREGVSMETMDGSVSEGTLPNKFMSAECILNGSWQHLLMTTKYLPLLKQLLK